MFEQRKAQRTQERSFGRQAHRQQVSNICVVICVARREHASNQVGGLGTLLQSCVSCVGLRSLQAARQTLLSAQGSAPLDSKSSTKLARPRAREGLRAATCSGVHASCVQ